MLHTNQIDGAIVQQWINAKVAPSAVEKELVAKGLDAETVLMYLKEFKRIRNSKRQFNGFVCLALGAFMGFISCVLSIINPVPQLYSVFLFGLTSVAVLIVFAGLYFLFE